MFRNFTACPHCAAKGLPGQLWRIEERTPSIVLSDGKSFHLILLSGPNLVPAPGGGLRANRLVGQFSYVHDNLGTEAYRVAVLLTRPGENFQQVTAQLEKAALKLAELLEHGTPLSPEYGFDGDVLWDLSAGYRRKLRPLCPLAIKQNQHEVHAPAHDTRVEVTCDACGDKFYVGFNRIYGARTTPEASAKKLEALLAEDHRAGRPHVNAYELPD